MKRIDLNLEQFHKFIDDKKCVCFGSGIQGQRIINIFENWGKAESILAFIDNNEKKWGQNITYDNFSYPIMSIDDVMGLMTHNVVIIITCADIINIRAQLEQYEALNDVYCFSLIEIAQQQLRISTYEKVVNEYQEPVIPKKIHYAWFGDEMPELLKKNIDNWHKICPDYEIIRWDENNYDIFKNRYMRDAYETQKWGYVPDYMRLDIIYQYGGIYLDTDVAIVKKPDELLFQDGFASFDSSLLMNLGAGFGARAGCEIIKELRDYYDSISFRLDNGEINTMSCMTHSYNILKYKGININDQLQKIGELNVYPMVFQGTCAYTKQMRIMDKTYFLHYGTTTWLNEKNNNVRKSLGKHFKGNDESDLMSYEFTIV